MPDAELPPIRYYIALVNGLHATAKLTPVQADSFGDKGPNEPIDIGNDGGAWYPVSEEIATAWTADDDG